MMRSLQTLGRLRIAILGISVIGVGGIALELAAQRHWHDIFQLSPWMVIGAILVCVLALLVQPIGPAVWLARVIAIAALGMTIVGGWQHFEAGYDVAPLNRDYTDRWETMPRAERIWVVVNSSATKHAPVLVPGVLAQAAILLAASTIGLDAKRRPAAAASPAPDDQPDPEPDGQPDPEPEALATDA